MTDRPKKKECPKCGAEFSCFAETKQRCWCMDVELSEDTLKVLNSDFNGCLCPDCLNELENSAKRG
ncbi:MAG: cysteine-rich CWC family protein [Bacteroidales bacterium]|jgi:ribosomal protein L34E|nr:cysteine-rich CWC family protein [Bacteroidales bacterium]